MPVVDPKPLHRPFRRVLYREDSKDSVLTQDVSPRSVGHLLTTIKKKSHSEIIHNNHNMIMADSSRRLLINEGVLYKSPPEKIKYIKHVRNNPMARYLFFMQKYPNARMTSISHQETYNVS